MADKVTTTTDFQVLWKKFFNSIRNDSNPQHIISLPASKLLNALFAKFNREGIDLATKRDLINRGFAKIWENFYTRVLWADRLLQLKEITQDINAPSYGLHDLIPIRVSENDDIAYQVLYADVYQVGSEEPTNETPYLYQVGSNGRTITSLEMNSDLSESLSCFASGKEFLYYDIATGDNGSIWFLYYKIPPHFGMIYDNTKRVSSIQLNGKHFSLDLIPAVYTIDAPNRNCCSVQRSINKTWYENETIAIRLDNLKSISPQTGAKYCINGVPFSFSKNESVSISKEDQLQDIDPYTTFNQEHAYLSEDSEKANKKRTPVLKIGEREIKKEESLEIQGPATLQTNSGKEIPLSKDERIVFNRNKHPLLTVYKADKQPIGTLLTSYFMGLLKNSSLEIKRGERSSLGYDAIDNDTYHSGSTASIKHQKCSGLEKGLSRAIFRIPNNEDEINNLSDKDVALLYCLNLAKEQVEELLDENKDRKSIALLSSIPENLNLFEFLEWYSLVIKTESGKSGQVFYPLLKTKLSDDHPDKNKETDKYPKLKDNYFEALNRLLVAKFPSLKRVQSNGKFHVEWNIDDSMKQTLKKIRKTLIENIKKPSEKIQTIEQDDKS